ncbi:MAG: molybdopterin-dependent oxidoreductase [Candidatus Riflebacteria bacterium]|nr:molybdopterin-dependent oxidoreductase [Candidatus Riflebacteria bacterium]
MKNVDLTLHVRGLSQFVDDIPVHGDCLHAVLFTSPVARGKIRSLDTGRAAAAPGVVAVFTHRDVPGLNQVGHIFKDQPLFAVESLEYIGQPIALVVAQTRRAAQRAARLITVDLEKLDAVFDPREAAARGMIHGQKRVLTSGDTTAAFDRCAHVVQGKLSSGPQEHFYFETQRALALPGEHDTIKVCASAQAPGAFHRHLAEVLGIPQHKVELDIRRLGGGFGGKESTAVWIVAPALAAFLLKRPVKLVLGRNEDIATTGKRHAYQYDYKIGLDAGGNILAYEVDLYQHAGACADISPAVLGRSFLHASGSYRIPNIRVTAVSCRTNIPPNNAFRGFGVPQGTFAIESALTHAAESMGVDAATLKQRNLLQDGDSLPYGARPEKVNALRCWAALDEQVDLAKRHREVADYNQAHGDTKRGLAVLPVCFGISFAQTALNQASALVHIYVDGSVAVSTGAVEMGQGVNTKIQIVAARTLGVGVDRVRVDTTNTSRIPNASPTSASTGADLNGMATKFACEELRSRLTKFAAAHLGCEHPDRVELRDEAVTIEGRRTDLGWQKLVAAAQWARIDLSSHAFYATPALDLDPSTERGRPFAYYSYGTSLTTVLLDVTRGTYTIEAIDVVHDVGQTLSEAIDRGQVEGAVIQGMGWATIEQSRYAPDGRVLTAVLLHALRAVRKDRPLPSLPLTPEQVFMYLHGP